jgi:hypothetical protein
MLSRDSTLREKNSCLVLVPRLMTTTEFIGSSKLRGRYFDSKHEQANARGLSVRLTIMLIG